jgi:uncharacterized RDD family membrane protein YckC
MTSGVPEFLVARSRSPLDRVVGAVVPRAVDAIDPDQVIDRLDVDALLQRVDISALVERVDLDAVLGTVDVDALIRRVDVDAVVQRIDLDALMARIDVDAILRRVDLDGLLARVDLDAALAEIDVAALAGRAGIDQIVADATSGLAARMLGLARRKIHSLDTALLRLVDRSLRRAPSPPSTGTPPPAGPLARVFGFLLDSLVVSTLFGLGVALGSTLFELFTTRTFDTADAGGPGWVIGFVAWWFGYLWLTVALSGRTVGKAILGLRITSADGSVIDAGRAALRAAAFPFSLVLGVGFLPAVFGRGRRALHDLVAGTAEVVDLG